MGKVEAARRMHWWARVAHGRTRCVPGLEARCCRTASV